jgi:hypothetical protein
MPHTFELINSGVDTILDELVFTNIDIKINNDFLNLEYINNNFY